MELKELVSKYKDAVLKHHEYSYKDAKITNENIYKYTEYYKELKKTKEGIQELKKMLYDENPVIQKTAATHMLPFDEFEAKTVLNKLLEAKIRLISFDVYYILKEWDNGNLKKDCSHYRHPPHLRVIFIFRKKYFGCIDYLF